MERGPGPSPTPVLSLGGSEVEEAALSDISLETGTGGFEPVKELGCNDGGIGSGLRVEVVKWRPPHDEGGTEFRSGAILHAVLIVKMNAWVEQSYPGPREAGILF